MRALTLLAIGIGIGILIAPDKGSKTRQKLADAMNDLNNKMKKKVSTITHEDEWINQESPTYSG